MKMRVLGIDPGTAIVGYGIIDYEKGKFQIVDYGCIYTAKDLPMEDRLVKIHEELSALIEKYRPEEMAVEELFYFKNNKTVISVGQARGVIVLTGRLHGLQMHAYTPLQVKMGITGYGRAEKKQIQQMVQRFLGLKEIPKPDDAADALAIAINHIHTKTSALVQMDSVCLKKLPKGTEKLSVQEYRELFLKK
ncbi:Holliday junction resolvase [Fusobacterium necrophorum subsp. funduliforme B35]|uniref:Crossover junction endodeoxyribonuclease RuvC n=2 Tax=Fusobacterium necrophorum TaxID=859 RepID=A0A0B4EJM6_9FUSO|nr:Holliday junction resolvase [Fusobacterium necrophorum subsp. funduliforme B35]